ncbi:class I lanthipeptide [Belliella marina]|uniref:Class I lanthipeptide n=1 Tax=Belliella marina TaxID=1644146 RepID=A0ABW4VGD0_9BACT
MKKKKMNPLDLNKETIAKLDEKQLEALAGGAGDPDEQDEATACITTKNTGNCGGCCGTKVEEEAVG